MKRQYLNDANDIAKELVFKTLGDGELLHDLAIDPLRTDGNWKAHHWDQYSNRFPKGTRLVNAGTRFTANKHIAKDKDSLPKYFGPHGTSKADIFFDPDTGIRYRSTLCTATPREKDEEYVYASEACRVASLSPERVVAVYQHGYRYKRGFARKRVLRKRAKYLRECLGTGDVCLFDVGTMILFFISARKSRVASILDSLTDIAGSTAAAQAYR